jgi:lipopolysaccharide/colanic/teichoic acid biosynthesis glycosyltransferase/CheY-like chemotaxis protein
MIQTLHPYEAKNNGVEWKWRFQAESMVDSESSVHNILLIGAAAAAYGQRLNQEGYVCYETASIHEARNTLLLEYFRLERPLPDAIICDIRMDESLISHFASYLSVTKEYASIPFIVLLGDDDNDGRHPQPPFDPSGLRGVDDVFDGGVTVEELCAKIDVLKKYKHFHKTLPYYDREPATLNEVIVEKIRPRRVFQRTLDILVSATALAALSPVFLLIGAAIRLDSKGSVLYASPRAGRAYRIFKFYKFRTMVADADAKIAEVKHLNQYDVASESGPTFLKIDNDPRVTRLGKFLRNTSMDELPQLINVLLGDMSLVGNRPLPLYEACTLTADESAQRFLAPAGMTGLWQIKKRGQPNMSVQERISLDIDYANQHSFLYDLRILLNTPKVLIQKADV